MTTTATAEASPPDHDALFVILVAPNVSEQMGGEAIRALHIFQELERQGVRVHQVTHSRVRPEIERKWPGMPVSYVHDDWLHQVVFRSVILRPALNLAFLWSARREIRALLRSHPRAVVHFTSPVSPVLPYFRIKYAPVVIGPVDGNIHYPPAFRDREPASYKLRRWLHPLVQYGQRLLFSGKQTADVLLVAGGERTFQSLRMAGCRDAQFVDSIDSGVPDSLCARPRVMHSGRNVKFVHNGRLMDHKGADLAIESLPLTRSPIVLDIIGRGPELPRLKELVVRLNLSDRVRFVEWFESPAKLAEALRECRAFVFPSLAEAHGIVVQEAMVMGLPVIALDWGGPGRLVTHETGILIRPISKQHVIAELARAMDLLSEDGDLADRMSAAGRARAEGAGYFWSGIIRRWREMYGELSARRLRSGGTSGESMRV